MRARREKRRALEGPKPPRPDTLRQRWDAKVKRGDGCWEWQGTKTKYGYGQIYKFQPERRNGLALAHRVAFELAFGPIPEGHDVHHICGNRGCVRPDHLEVLTRLEHASRHLV
jgi:hypothetical protein